jgi:hypothetical protein
VCQDSKVIKLLDVPCRQEFFMCVAKSPLWLNAKPDSAASLYPLRIELWPENQEIEE